MKHQYFGDVNDYRKYSLLRCLTNWGELSAAICWMLVPNDGGADGGFTGYLEKPGEWRRFDPELFDKLRETVAIGKRRHLCLVETEKLLPSARFYNEVLLDDREARSRYFEGFWDMAEGCDLIFFDPDNGMEVKSRPCGRKNSSKYLYWSELVKAFSTGCSVLVYQHFPREKRDLFIARMAEEVMSKTGAQRVYSFRTSHVVFFLLAAEHQEAVLERNADLVSQTWGDQTRMQRCESAQCVIRVGHSLLTQEETAPPLVRARRTEIAYPPRFVACTLNLWAEHRWPERQEALRQFLKHHLPDILCVQELRPATRKFIDTVLKTHRRVEDPFEGWLREGNIYWNRQLFDLVEYGEEDIGIAEELRRLFWVRLRLRTGDGPTLFVSTAHYTWAGNAQEAATGLNPRLAQARRTVEALQRLAPSSEPLLFMGDLNDALHPLRILREGGLTDSFEALGCGYRPTYPTVLHSSWPPVTLDWMLHRGAILPMTGEVVDLYVDGVCPSDHKPVVTTYRLLAV